MARPRRRWDRLTRLAVWEGGGRLCALCGHRIGWRDLHLDHVVPLAAGGRDALANLQPTHAGCNLAKGATLP